MPLLRLPLSMASPLPEASPSTSTDKVRPARRLTLWPFPVCAALTNMDNLSILDSLNTLDILNTLGLFSSHPAASNNKVNLNSKHHSMRKCSITRNTIIHISTSPNHSCSQGRPWDLRWLLGRTWATSR